MTSPAVSALRALTHRLSCTPTAELPRCVAQLSASIWTCRDLISAPADSLKRLSDDDSVSIVVHRLKTQLSALLQDRTAEGRWAAIVLIKAVIEAGSLEVLSKCNVWVRGLLAILKRRDPPSTRALAIVVLTRIFTLTWDHVSLVREITTPALPTFVSTCLSNATNKHCSADELLNILEAFQILLPHHHTIFRTNDTLLRALLVRIIWPDECSAAASEIVVAAQRLLSLLPHITPKQGGAEKWDDSLQALVESAHQTCDQIFRPIIEPTGSRHARAPALPNLSIASTEDDPAGLPPWTGLTNGIGWLVVTLDTIAAYFQTTTPSTVAISVGKVFDLLSRVLAVTVPHAGKHSFTKVNPEYTREDRDLFLSALPAIHIAAFQLWSSLLQRLGPAGFPFLSSCYEHVSEVFAAETFHTELRSVIYSVVASMLELDGLSASKERIAQLVPVLQSCCKDIFQDDEIPLQPARNLLVTVLTNVDSRYIPRNLRTLMDRSAVLTRNKAALLASVLNPAPSPTGTGLQPSLLPILARLFPSEPEVEALVRPRMAVLRAGTSSEDLPDEEAVFVVRDEPEDNAVQFGQRIDDLEDSIVRNATGNAADQATAFAEYLSNKQKRSMSVESAGSAHAKRVKPTADRSSSPHTARSEAHPTALDEGLQTSYDAAPIATAYPGDDDSDIELPPLTLEQDTDDESA